VSVTGRLTVELVLATADRQVLLTVDVDAGASVADVIAVSGIESQFPALAVNEMPAGIWGRQVPRETAVRQGDRIELYRPLEIDPREARRQRASAGEA
jgi:putative ubiquitin-RnfH superfamily antitoxin RatB of RatAB toxin-antitoxin module